MKIYPSIQTVLLTITFDFLHGVDGISINGAANGEGLSTEETINPRGRVHPIQSSDDLRVLNPWAGVQGFHRGESKYDIATRERLKQKAKEREKEKEKENDRDSSDEEGGYGSNTRAERELQRPNPPEGPPAVIYLAIIVGAGPGGCAAAHTLVEEGINPASILVLERGPSLQAYKDKGYDHLLNFRLSQSDPDFRENIPGTPIVLGRGVGGGTNHFGMQFIDQVEVSNATSRQPVPGSDVSEEVTTFSNFSGASTYSDEDYSVFGVNESYADTYANIDGVLSGIGKSYRNNVYKTAGNIMDPPRLLVGDLIHADVNLRSDSEVERLARNVGRDSSGRYHCVFLTDGTRECARKILLAANALNSARLALNARRVVTPHGRFRRKRYLQGLWDHQGIVFTYYPPGTSWDSVQPTPISDESKAGLTVYESVQAAIDAMIALNETTWNGFVGYVTVGVLSQAQVDSILARTWAVQDPAGTDRLKYLFDLGDFFRSNAHPGGNKESNIAANGYDIGKTIDELGPDSHQDGAKISRILRAGGKLIGILDDRQPTLSPNYSTSTGLVNASYIIPHVQARPDHHKWQFYHTPIPALDYLGNEGDILIGVMLTGEQIQDDGRVYEGDAVSADTVRLPSFTDAEFSALRDCSLTMDQVLSNLGWTAYGGGSQVIPDTLEGMMNHPGFLPSTYHYHGTLCPHTDPLAKGFHACDLSRMCRKWAGSTSAASGGMGVQCGRVVADELKKERFVGLSPRFNGNRR